MIEDTTHFLEIERPEAACEALTAFLARHGHGVVVPDRSRLQLPEKQGY